MSLRQNCLAPMLNIIAVKHGDKVVFIQYLTNI